MFQYPANEFLGMNVIELFAIEKRDKYELILKNLLNTEAVNDPVTLTDTSLVKKDGTKLICDISICEYELDGQRLITGIVHDITQKKVVTDQLIDSERRALLTTIASGIGHEMNNSLTSLMGYVDILTSKNSPDEKKDRATLVIKSQLEKLSILTSNLLELGKSKSFFPNGLEANDKSELNSLIKESISIFGNTARTRNCEITVNLFPEDIWTFGHKDQINLMISNLILNAADATKNKGRIHITTTKVDGFGKVEIEDNGCGIPLSDLPKIYEPYFTTKEEGKGTGLGLFVVKEISSRLQVDIEIITSINVGTSFVLTFPLA